MDLHLSEVHIGRAGPEQCAAVTAFKIKPGSSQQAKRDEDGDLIVTRTHDKILMHHGLATLLNDVGLQVWPGALLLADYLLDQRSYDGCTAVELGAGPGLAGIALARQAAQVFLTDVGAEVLCNCRKNVDANAASFKHGPQVAQVRQLDWLEPLPQSCPQSSAGDDPSIDFSWCKEDVQALQHAQVFLAADCIYDNDLSEAFMRTAAQLLRGAPSSNLLLALERRFNFTLRDMDVAAPAYDYWRTLFAEKHGNSKSGLVGHQVAYGPHLHHLHSDVDMSNVELWQLAWPT